MVQTDLCRFQLKNFQVIIFHGGHNFTIKKNCGLQPVLRKSISSEIGKKRHGPVYPVVDWCHRFFYVPPPVFGTFQFPGELKLKEGEQNYLGGEQKGGEQEFLQGGTIFVSRIYYLQKFIFRISDYVMGKKYNCGKPAPPDNFHQIKHI